MKRLLAAAALVAVAGTAAADIPPPKGLRRIPLEHKITTEKEFPDFALYAVSGGDKAEAVKLDPKTPATVTAGGGRYRSAQLVAVPKDAAKKYPSEKEFLAAVAAEKVDGLLKAKNYFSAFTTVKDADTRKTIVVEYKLEKVDPKDGIVLTEVNSEREPKKGESRGGEDDEAAAYAPRGGAWVAGLTAAAGLAFGGVWVARRGRRGVAG
jgi:hypothetical protein